MIHPIPHAVSEGLRKENEAHRQALTAINAAWIRDRFPTRESFFRDYSQSAEGAQLREALKDSDPAARILDVGAGHGTIPIYLASLGYQVSALEPSPDLCAYIDRAATVFDLHLEIYQAPAEAIHRLHARHFDACMFNASLHHCDEPVRALANCYEILAPGGKLFLLNEPLLQFFRSKAWFARRLRQGNLITGDYGGNEHTYYHHEYVAMLRQAGFGDVRDRVALRYLQPESYFHYLDAQHASRRALLARRLYYAVIARIGRSRTCGRPVLYLLRRLSLLQTVFTATRRAA